MYFNQYSIIKFQKLGWNACYFCMTWFITVLQFPLMIILYLILPSLDLILKCSWLNLLQLMHTDFFNVNIVFLWNSLPVSLCTLSSRKAFCSVFNHFACTVEPPLSGPLLSGHLHCRTAQISLVAWSLLTIMKFGLDESTRREPKGCCLPVRWLVYSTYHNYQVITHFYSPGERPWMYCGDLVCLLTAQHWITALFAFFITEFLQHNSMQFLVTGITEIWTVVVTRLPIILI